MDGNLFVYVNCFPPVHVASWSSVRNNFTKTKIKEIGMSDTFRNGLISQVQNLPVFNPEVPCTTIC